MSASGFTHNNNQTSDKGAIPVRIAIQIAPDPAALPTPPPATIAASGTWDSGAINASGFNGIAASAQLDQAGSLTIQRYIDASGTLAIGLPITQVMTANVLATVWANDGMPFASWNIVVTNTSGSTAALSNVAILEVS